MGKFKSISMIACAAILFSCTDEDNSKTTNPTASEVIDRVDNGEWKIINYVKNGAEETEQFADFEFTFDNQNVLNATSGTTVYAGSWIVRDAEGGEVDFNISFTGPDEFADLSDDWSVVQVSKKMVKLKEVTDAGTNYLTFKRQG